MAFEATKRELGELYTFFRLLADGKVSLGTPQARKDETKCWPVALIQREEHDGTRRYYIEQGNVRIVSGVIEKEGTFVAADKEEQVIPREDFGGAAEFILELLKTTSGTDAIEVPEGLEAFLDAVNIYDLEAKTEDRTDFSVAFWHPEAPLTGFNVRCRLSSMNPLLDGGRTANLKLEQSGVKFATPTVNKVNALPESPTEVTERMLMIERLGGVLKYSDVADRVFRCNLLMIDLHFPRMLAEMVRMMHLDGIARISELTERIKEINPLKIKDELINKHGFYEFKMKQFLLALAFGMRPAKIYNGTDSAVEGILLVDAEGEVLCYHKSEHRTFADFLFLQGGIELLDKVAAIVTNAKCQGALNDLRKIYKLVDAYGAAGYLSFDLGLYRSLDYYTGMLFEVYLPEMGYPVAGGGRYDKMMQRFGLECPATGFAVGVDRVLLALERNGVATNNRTWDVLVAWSEGKLPEAIAKATALRREGRSVKLLTEAADLQGAALAVKEYGCKSLVYVE